MQNIRLLTTFCRLRHWNGQHRPVIWVKVKQSDPFWNDLFYWLLRGSVCFLL